MAWNDLTVEQLQATASEHGLTGYSSLNKSELIKLIEDAGVVEPADIPPFQVSGVQTAPHVPPIPRTPRDFAKLLDNPDVPAQNQSAPPQELLNPHLYPAD